MLINFIVSSLTQLHAITYERLRFDLSLIPGQEYL